MILLDLGAASLHAQVTTSDAMSHLKRGLQVRAVLRQGPQPLLRGKVESSSGDTVMVRVRPDSLASYSLEDLATLEIYRRSRAADGLSQVLFVVGAAGGATAYVNWCFRNTNACAKLDEDPDPYDDEKPTPMIVTFPLITGLLMAALGHALAPPRWEPVNLPVRVGVAPLRNGALLYVSLRAR